MGLNPTNWICVDGVELVNGYRTNTYLARGLAGAGWLVERGNTYPVGSTYTDVNGDPHVVGVFSPMNLCDWCEQGGDPAGYVDPATDAAPWYVAARPESAEFLGVLLTDMDVRPVARRAVTQLAAGGAAIGRNIPTALTAACEGLLVASSAQGMEYGRRWVADVLSGGACGCGVGEVVYLPACPADAEVDTGYRRLARAGLVDGPSFDRMGDIGDCKVTQVSWQWAAGVPYLLSQPEQVGDTETLVAAGTASFGVTTEEWNGDVGVVIRLTTADAGVAATDIHVVAYPVPEGESCPIAGSPGPCVDYTVSSLAPLAVMEIDSAASQVVLHGATSKAVEAAWPWLEFDGPWAWLVVPPCSTTCVTVTNGAGGDVDVEVFAVAREF